MINLTTGSPASGMSHNVCTSPGENGDPSRVVPVGDPGQGACIDSEGFDFVLADQTLGDCMSLLLALYRSGLASGVSCKDVHQKQFLATRDYLGAVKLALLVAGALPASERVL